MNISPTLSRSRSICPVTATANLMLACVKCRGYFGASTPQLVSNNPTDMYTSKFLDTVLFPAARICNGEDSSAILSLPHIDLASMHIYPEYWSFCTE